MVSFQDKGIFSYDFAILVCTVFVELIGKPFISYLDSLLDAFEGRNRVDLAVFQKIVSTVVVSQSFTESDCRYILRNYSRSDQGEPDQRRPSSCSSSSTTTWGS